MLEKDEQTELEEIEKEIAGLFNNDQDSSPEEKEQKPAENTQETKKSEEEKRSDAKAFSIRLNEEREKIAKEAGFESYEDMRKQNEKKKLEDKGLDPEVASPVLEELVKQRVEQDPRIKEYEELKKKEQEREFKEWCDKEVKQLTSLTDGKIKSLSDVPQDVVKLSEKTGSLKSAYLQLHGEELISQIKLKQTSQESKGTTNHMAQIKDGVSPQGKTRPLTPEERRAYKMINKNITDEELDKKVKYIN